MFSRLFVLLSCLGLAFPGLALLPVVRAGVPINAQLLSSGYIQNFDTLASSGTFTWANNSTLPGWHAANPSSAVNASGVASTGSGNLSHLSLGSLGASSSSDRALAYHTQVVTAPTYLGVEFINTTGFDLNGFALSYTPEQWRENTSVRTLSLAVEYRVAATAADLASATGWTALPGLGFATATGGGGGSVGATATRTSGVVAVVVSAGASLWLRWATSNDATTATSSNDILAIDNVSVAFTASTEASAPSIVTPPLAQTLEVGATATFTVVATGNPSPSLQWFKGTSPITGATSATLTLINVQLGHAGDYSVTATNALGSTSSAAVALTVSSPVVDPGDGGGGGGGTPEVPPPPGDDLYVAPDGLASAPGTYAEPTTLANALAIVTPGRTIFLRGGTYAFSTQITIALTNTGSSALYPKRLFAYVPPGGSPERPVLDFSSQPYGSTSSVSNPRGIQLDGSFWHLRGLEIKGAADNGIYITGHHNIVERCVTHHNRDTGIQIGRRASTTLRADWPSYNLVLNCDSHDNYDAPPNGGENADGFAAKLTSGAGNVFRGCVARNNIDDGWDLFTKTDTGPIDPVVIDQCIAYSNGTLSDGTTNAAGDRNGFKLGGESIAVPHIVTRSIAMANGKNGFTWNSNPGAIRLVNNFAFNNAQGNYKFDLPGPIFRNNVSLWTTGNGQNDRYGGNSGIATGPTNVFWFASGTPKSRNDRGFSVSAASFVSLAIPAGGFPRLADGALDLGDFGRLVAGHALIDTGELVGLPDGDVLPFVTESAYHGLPDIGARESFPAPLALSTWATTHALVGPAAQPDADPDGDGRPNLLEYALGLRPGQPDAADAGPQFSAAPTGWTFRYPLDRMATGLVTVVETSTDLIHWRPVPAIPQVESAAGMIDNHVVPLPVMSPQAFVRLRVTQP